MSVFQFKQFSIHHEQASMKVGTDAILLGAWTQLLPSTCNILDVGTGTGIIALMLAQRTSDNTSIDAVESSVLDAEGAIKNVMESLWRDRISIHIMEIQHYYPNKKFDLIVSNPPYFNNSYTPSKPGRAQARHTHSLSQEELLVCIQRLLKPTGRLSVILPYEEGELFIQRAALQHLHCIRKTVFKSRPAKPIERLLLEFSSEFSQLEFTELIHYQEKNDWTEEFRNLTKNFYINL